MKNYFLKLIDYDHHTNQTLVQLIIEAGEPEKAVKLMAHMLAAQQVWLTRCKYLPPPGSNLWPDWQAGTFEQIINDNHGAWVEYLSGLDHSAFENIVHYKNTRDDIFDNKLEDIMAHLINHGTHHRAQIGQELKLAGVEKLPITDYIFYIRGK
jgi:uncharacterized damage-inducible protein DinB